MINEYIIVYTLYTFIIIGLSIFSYDKRYKTGQIKIILLVLIFFESLIAAFRPEKTQDTAVYNYVYEMSSNWVSGFEKLHILDMFSNRTFNDIELFYIIIMSFFRKIFESPVVFYFVQGFISNILILYGLFLISVYTFKLTTTKQIEEYIGKYGIHIYCLYFFVCGILYTSSAIRDGLSIAFGIVGIANLLLDRKKILSSFFIAVSIMIHTTSIIFVPIYILVKFCNKNMSRRWMYILTILIPLFYFGKIGTYTVQIVCLVVEKILQFFGIQAFYSYIKNLDFQLPMREGMIIVITCVIIIVLLNNYNIQNNNVTSFINLTLLGMLVFVFAYPIPALIRLLYIFIIIFIPCMMFKSRYRNLVYILWILYLIPQFVYVFGYIK